MTKRSTTFLIALCASLLAGLATLALGNYRLNFSPSSAYGLWQIEPLVRAVRVGDRLFVCPPTGEISQLGRERGYLADGLCPSNVGPLIKTVAALPGQSIEVGDQVVIDGKALANSTHLEVDARGRVMGRYGGGRVPKGTVFLHSEFFGSYDSRYFGPVPTEGVLGLAREVITFVP